MSEVAIKAFERFRAILCLAYEGLKDIDAFKRLYACFCDHLRHLPAVLGHLDRFEFTAAEQGFRFTNGAKFG